MSIPKQTINDGVDTIISSTLNRYGSVEDINDAFFGDFGGLNIEEDLVLAIQNRVSVNTEFWDNTIGIKIINEQSNTSDSPDFTSGVLKGGILGYTEELLTAQKNITITATKTIKAITSETISVERAFIEYFDNSSIKIYLDKSTSTIIRSETILSETTHIPIGKTVAGLGKLIGKAAIIEGFKDAATSAYEAATNPEDITAAFQAFSDLSLVGGATIVGFMTEKLLGGGFLGGGGGALVTNIIIGSADAIEQKIGEAYLGAYNLTKTTEEMLEDLGNAVESSLNDIWDAKGQDAIDILQGAEQKTEDFFDGLRELKEDYEWAVENPDAVIVEATEEFFNSFSDLEKELIKTVETKTVEGVIYNSTQTYPFLMITENGLEQLVNINVAEAKIVAQNARIADFEANGTVLSDVTDTVQLYGVTFNSREQIIERNGEVIKTVEYNLVEGGALPSNGVTYQKYEFEMGANGQFYVSQENTSFVDAFGYVHNTVEQKQSEDGNWIVQENIAQPNGEVVPGDTYVVPSQDLLNSLQLAGGTVGSFLGAQLADGNAYQDIIYSTLLKTIGQHFGTFTAYLAQEANSFSGAVDAAMGGSIEGTAFENAEFSESFFNNLNSKVSSVLANVIVEEVGDVLGIDSGTVGGEIFNVVGNTVTTGIIQDTFGLLFNGIDTGVYTGIVSNGFNFSQPYPPNTQGITGTVGDYVQVQVVDALAAYAGGRLAGEVVEAESQTAALLGSVGSAFGTAIASGSILTTTAVGSAFQTLTALGSLGGPVGIAIGTFVGTVVGTLFGNLISGEDDEPQAWSSVSYEQSVGEYIVGSSWGADGGDPVVATSMAQQVIQGINEIIEVSHGTLRSGESAPRIQIGFEGSEFQVSVNGGELRSFGTTAGAINYAAFKVMKDFDLVGGHAVIMRAWHNSEATNMYEWLEDIQVAEAFQNYLANPTAILALMMNDPDSALAQSWATILQRAAELELHLPHEKDLDGGWGEVLLAQGVSSDLIPSIEGDSIVLTNPITGEETIMHHIIGPGYEIVRIEGTDGDDIIEVIVDGPSISYVDGGEGNDIIEGSDQVDVLVGGSGDDIINGNDGDDWLHGGAGDDTLDGGGGEDLVVGGQNNDSLIGGVGSDQIYGNGGDDYLFGGDGRDFLFGGVGNDTLDGGAGSDDELYGGAGDDILISSDNDKLYGGKGDDTYRLTSNSNGAVYIAREDGHDTVELGTGSSKIVFHKSISMNELFYERQSDDLKIYILGEDQSVLLKNFFSSGVSAKIHVINGAFALDNLGSSTSTASIIAAYNESILDKLSTNNVLSNGVLAQAQNYQINNLGDIHRKLTPFSNYFSNADVLDENSNTYYFRNQHDWSTQFKFGGAGNDIIAPEDTNYSGTPFSIYGDSGNDRLYGANNKDTIVGGLGEDIISGRGGDDAIYGGYDNDTLYGGNGNDLISGGFGDDLIYGGNHDDKIDGGVGNDTILGESGNDLIKGGEGDDNIEGGVGNDTIHGGLGADILTGDDGDDTIFGDEGDDIIDGGEGDDWISGGNGDDILNGGGGRDLVNGGEGDDTFLHVLSDNADNNNEYYGGEGIDKLSLYLTSAEYALSKTQGQIYHFKTNQYLNSIGVAIITFAFLNILVKNIEEIDVYADDVLQNLSFNQIDGSDEGGTISASVSEDLVLGGDGDDVILGLAGHDDLYGGLGSDNISGGEDSDAIYGESGNDIIAGDSGDDYLFGGSGQDIISGGAGDDYIEGNIGEDNLSGGDGNDHIEGGEGDDIILAGAGNDTINGGSGIDTVSFINSLSGIYLDLNLNTVFDDGLGGEDVILNVENIIGSDFNDIIRGNHDNLIMGGSGRDSIYMHSGVNVAYGGLGNDRFETSNSLSSSEHTLFGGVGNDVFILGTNGNNIIEGGTGQDFITYMEVNNSLHVDFGKGEIDKNSDGIADDTFKSIERFNGSKVGDIIIGGSEKEAISGVNGDDFIRGGAGNDNLYGNNNNDILLGGSGRDRIYGGRDDDIIAGQGGFDNLYGQAGNDTFVFEQATAFDDVDIIQDFNLNEDMIDLSDLLSLYDSQTHSISDFVQITDDGTSSFLAVDVSGTGNDFQQIALIKNIVGLNDVVALETQGKILTNTNFSFILNNGPVAQSDAFDGVEGQNILGNLFVDNGNGVDFDIDNEIISAVVETVNSVSGGVAVISANGDFVYTPVEGFSGSDSFSYTIEDDNGGSSVGSVNITVESLNESPVAMNDVFNGNQDQNIVGNVLSDNGNGVDNDPDGDTLSVVAEVATSVSGGSVNISSDGSFIYIPMAGFIGTDSFSYTLNDNHGNLDSGTAQLTIVSTNTSPVAMDDNFTGTEDQDIAGNVLADNGNGVDSDPDGDNFNVVAVTIASTQGGSAVLLANGDFIYTPLAGYSGADSFTYTLEDGQGGTHVGIVNVTVEALPVVDIIEGTSETDLLLGTEDGDFIYGYGSDDIIKGLIGDDIIYGGDGNDKIYGNAGNNALYGEAGNDTFYLNEGNDIVDGGLGVNRITYMFSGVGVDINLESGTVDEGRDGVINDTLSSIIKADGSNHDDIIVGNGVTNILNGKNGDDVIYGGAGNDNIYGGNDNDILYGGDGLDRLRGQNGSDIFVFEQDSAFNNVDFIFDFNLSQNDKIDISDLLRGYNPVTDSLSNFVQIIDNGTYSYIAVDVNGGGNNFQNITKLNNVTGLSSVDALENDGVLITSTVEVVPNTSPVAMDDNFTGTEDQDIAGNVLADNGNGVDSDPDGDNLNVVAATIASTQGGSAVLLANGDFIYTPLAGYSGADSFTYTLEDGQGGTHVGIVNVTVEALPDANIIEGTDNNDVINGTDDNDIIRANAGNDKIYSGLGDDMVYGGIGNDTFYDQGGNDHYDGGDGNSDRVNYIESLNGVTVNLETGTVDEGSDGIVNDTFIDIENITATNYDDVLNGDLNGNHILGVGGNDLIHGYGGNDTLYGGVGDDIIYGGDGNDLIYGDTGNNILYGEAGNDTFFLKECNDIIDGGLGTNKVAYNFGSVGINANLEFGTVDEGHDGTVNDTLSSISNIDGSNYNDIIIGDDTANFLNGKNGDDVIYGGAGNDNLYGGNDNDILYGGNGLDKLRGQSGEDIFVFEQDSAFNNVDVVQDFKLSENDKIDLSDLLDAYDSSVDVLSDFVQITDDGAHSYLAIDADGGGNSFQQIAKLNNIINLSDIDILENDGVLIL